MAETTRSDGGRSSGLFFRPPAHLPQARAPVVRDALENLEGHRAIVFAGLQRLHVPLEVDCAFSERQVLVAGLAVASVVVVRVHEPEAAGPRPRGCAGAGRAVVGEGVTHIRGGLEGPERL